LILKTELTGERVLEPSVTFLISHILLDNNARVQAFGEGSQLIVKGHPEVSVKTGTTNDRRDNWTIGYTENTVVVTWVGNNDNTEMSGAVSGVSGASPIWNKIIKAVLDKAEKGAYDASEDGHVWPKQPDGVVGATICSDTGGLPGSDPGNPGCPTRFEYFLKGTIPYIICCKPRCTNL
jgi:membrane carboxypeptidase/penicillin-binding protein PbpC